MLHTSTTIMKFMECPRKWYYNQMMGFFRKGMSIPLGVGIKFHDLREHQFQSRDWETSFNHVFKDWYGGDIMDVDMRTLQKIAAMVKGMAKHCPWDFKGVMGVEKEFYVHDLRELDIHLMYPDSVAIKIDQWGYTEGFGSWISDYKTRSTVSDIDTMRNENRWKMDFQSSFYWFVADRAVLKEMSGFRFLMVSRSGIQQRKKRNPESYEDYLFRLVEEYTNTKKYYAEMWVKKHEMMTDFRKQLEYNLRNLQACREHCNFPMKYTQCSSPRGVCEYLPICTKSDGWEHLYDKFGPDHHPELTNVEEISRAKSPVLPGENDPKPGSEKVPEPGDHAADV